MGVNEDLKQLNDIMAMVFPGYEDFSVDSVVPSISGEPPVVSLMIVCSQEASGNFGENKEILAEVSADVVNSSKETGYDLNIKVEFSFPLYNLQFFAVIEGEEQDEQRDFARLLTEIDYFIIWLVDGQKNLLSVLQVAWNKEVHKEILGKIIDFAG